MNQIILIGKVGKPNFEKDNKVQISKSGKNYVRFSMFTTRGKGEQKQFDWHNVTVFGYTAQNVNKGDEVCVVGEYVQNEYKDKNGNVVRNHQVNAFRMMVGVYVDRQADFSSAQSFMPPPEVAAGIVDDDVPF